MIKSSEKEFLFGVWKVPLLGHAPSLFPVRGLPGNCYFFIYLFYFFYVIVHFPPLIHFLHRYLKKSIWQFPKIGKQFLVYSTFIPFLFYWHIFQFFSFLLQLDFNLLSRRLSFLFPSQKVNFTPVATVYFFFSFLSLRQQADYANNLALFA